ncbi:hypothetical protein ABIE89_000701 [Bradyrhizobium niftali]|uniref:hypothetical protein n=1 Tax=Bradyrhizobium niftali TaxID=2560055 RepID=UPI0038347E97
MRGIVSHIDDSSAAEKATLGIANRLCTTARNEMPARAVLPTSYSTNALQSSAVLVRDGGPKIGACAAANPQHVANDAF